MREHGIRDIPIRTLPCSPFSCATYHYRLSVSQSSGWIPAPIFVVSEHALLMRPNIHHYGTTDWWFRALQCGLHARSRQQGAHRTLFTRYVWRLLPLLRCCPHRYFTTLLLPLTPPILLPPLSLPLTTCSACTASRVLTPLSQNDRPLVATRSYDMGDRLSRAGSLLDRWSTDTSDSTVAQRYEPSSAEPPLAQYMCLSCSHATLCSLFS